jgi:hypothetical protein
MYIHERVEHLINEVEGILEDEDLIYLIEEHDLVSKIMDYYREHGILSEKQKYCLCRAIAEVDYHYGYL